jgi:DNA modification methylase
MKIKDRIVELVRIPANELMPNPKNWRTHSKKQLDALKGVLAEIGFAGAALGRRLPSGDVMLIDWHARTEVSGTSPIPVLILDVTESEADTILATFDPLGAMAGADAAKLDELLSSVQTQNEAIIEMLEQTAKDAGSEWAQGEPTPSPGEGGDEFDTTPEDTGPTKTNVSEMWLIGGKHRMLVGDCTNASVVTRLMGGETAGMVWSDPPYGYSYQSNMREKSAKFEVIANDDKILAGFVPIAAQHSKGWILVCTSWKVLEEWITATKTLGAIQNIIVWDKGGGGMGDLVHSLLTDYELVIAFNRGAPIYGKRIGSVWSIGKDRAIDYQHATQKPVELVAQALTTFSDEKSLVYDPFLGSGTTLIAAHRLGRICYGCELEPRYADVILKRAEAEGMTCERVED